MRCRSPPSTTARTGPARNDTERALAAAFADVLELDRVGIDEDFFDLGGNSLRAIRLVGLIRTELDQEVSIRRLFARPHRHRPLRHVAGPRPLSRPTLRRRDEGGAPSSDLPGLHPPRSLVRDVDADRPQMRLQGARSGGRRPAPGPPGDG
ncbi:phosphopantetheine-binding protein [Streptomyces sp. KL116D]|uniref:phosphopantetheine-binding protein n=1 Tax=Streptomyces sp. KL116D TaxID=3045152 RepID=UPI003558FF48